MNSNRIKLGSVGAVRARSSALASPTLVPASTLPCRLIAPPAKSSASARLVFPAPPGPTSATTLHASHFPSMTASPPRCTASATRSGRRYANVAQSSAFLAPKARRSEEHTSDLQSLLRTSYAVFFLKHKKQLSINQQY